MDAKQILKKYFGYDTFKPGQEEIIDAVWSGKDVLAIMPAVRAETASRHSVFCCFLRRIL